MPCISAKPRLCESTEHATEIIVTEKSQWEVFHEEVNVLLFL